MPTKIDSPATIPSVGEKPKVINEYIGRVNSNHTTLSIAHMQSPEGWKEPGQRPDFDEYTIVLKGTLCAETESGDVLEIHNGQAIFTHKGEWIRYSTPHPGGADYIAVCIPAFSPETVHRDE